MRDQIKMTDEEILAAFDEAGHEYLDIEDLTFSAETLDDFKVSAQTWAECREVSNEEYNGLAAVEFDGVQVNPGQPRHALTVIDFGEIRAAYKI